MEVEEIGSVTRLTGSICIRFDPLDELFIALRRAFAVSPPPPPSPSSSARSTLVEMLRYQWRRQRRTSFDRRERVGLINKRGK